MSCHLIPRLHFMGLWIHSHTIISKVIKITIFEASLSILTLMVLRCLPSFSEQRPTSFFREFSTSGCQLPNGQHTCSSFVKCLSVQTVRMLLSRESCTCKFSKCHTKQQAVIFVLWQRSHRCPLSSLQNEKWVMVILHVLYLLGSTHASPTVSLAPVENLYHSLLQEEGTHHRVVCTSGIQLVILGLEFSYLLPPLHFNY